MADRLEKNPKGNSIYLSIVIPHRDTPKKLRRLLDSIDLDCRIEVIVVDDNSAHDLSAMQLRKDFQLARFLRNPGPDFNAGSARNYGLLHSDGDWVLFADADDYFASGGIGAVMEAIANTSNKVDIVHFNVSSWDEASQAIGTRHQSISRKIKQFLLDSDEIDLRYRTPGPIAKLFRKSMVDNHRIQFDSLIAANDAVFSLKCGHFAREIRAFDTVIYTITAWEGSLTSKLTSERALARLCSLVRQNQLLMKWRVNRRLDWGFTAFVHSLSANPSKEKSRIYASYVRMLYSKILYGVLSRIT